MKLKDKAKPAIPPMEASVYMAVCVAVVDLGDQYSEKFKNTSRKVVFAFDIPSETVEIDGEQKPRQLSKRCTFSMNKKGNLSKMLNAWLNANMSEKELGEIDLFTLIGRGCQIRVTVSEDGAHNNIEDVLALPKGILAPQSSTLPITYDIDEDGFQGDKWEALPNWMRETIQKSEQYQENQPDQPLDMPPAEAVQSAPDNSAQSTLATEEGECPI